MLKKENYIEIMRHLGLGRDEAQIYLACLQNKQGLFVHEIVTRSGVNRSTTDVCIKRLLDKNYLSRFQEGRRSKFVATSPERILVEFQRSIEGLSAVLPKLLKGNDKQDKTQVSFFKGLNGMASIHKDIVRTMENLPPDKQTLHILTEGKSMEKAMPDLHREFILPTVKKRIKKRVLAMKKPRHETWNTDSSVLRETKHFDGNRYPCSSDILIAHDKIFFVSAKEPVGGITIKNERIASSFQSLFSMLWELLGPVDPDVKAHKTR